MLSLLDQTRTEPGHQRVEILKNLSIMFQRSGAELGDEILEKLICFLARVLIVTSHGNFSWLQWKVIVRNGCLVGLIG